MGYENLAKSMNQTKETKKLTDEWFTPINLLIMVRKFYSEGFFDPACCEEAQKYVGASSWCDRQQNSLNQTGNGSVWLNPPYSQPLVEQFTNKLINSYQKKLVTEGLCLVNNSTETVWFQNLGSASDRLLLFRGRLRFWHPEKRSDSPRYGQALFYLGDRCDRFEEIFCPLGLVYSKPRWH